MATGNLPTRQPGRGGSTPWRRFQRHRLAQVGLVILVLQVLFVSVGPLLSAHTVRGQQLARRYEPPSAVHWMGTDELGRDLMVRLMQGGRISLVVAFMSVGFAVGLGSTLGALAGYYRKLDGIIMRFVDLILAFPAMVILIFLASYFGTSFWTVVMVVGALRWMPIARIVRASFLSLREMDFVDAAEASGASELRIIFRHLLPNTYGPIIVNCTLGVATAILLESTLSFLGFGIQPPMPTWGNMLRNAQAELYTAPWVAVFPGVSIFMAVMSINFVGDGLRDAYDPRKKV